MLIDGIVINAGTFIIQVLIVVIWALTTGKTEEIEVERIESLLILIGLVVAWLYYALMESSARRATIGKLILGVIVTDVNADRVSFGRATGRHVAKVLSIITLLLGFILAGFTDKKQALRDMIAGCLVVRKA